MKQTDALEGPAHVIASFLIVSKKFGVDKEIGEALDDLGLAVDGATLEGEMEVGQSEGQVEGGGVRVERQGPGEHVDGVGVAAAG